ncbi:efflux RND transporter periplasmic adaptor subunit [Cohnella thailandensis]|uniref:Biotin/lipoyl-binding protein n=1 Tax=Cohnella thailandensis TaxID=557557 RepID=A0A841T0M7_9BACL|nr:biotin/lipoyl-binding protein [Cohnella thailandensis]MBB6637092.1 biotin/lipoyl-binding protein [Cohnella thailandensis]MBP1973017.1 multidrug efflux pump subunit AcrA (membrane-fusion protein) [Cohnella thailandensis]
MEERMTSSRRKKLRLLTGLFLALLVGCTLAGNTLRNLALPRVYLASAGSGTILHPYEGTATVMPKESKEIVNPAGWKVARILVKAGDPVTQGQPLIVYDDSETREQLLDMQTELKKSTLSMSLLQSNYREAAISGDEQKKENARVAIETAKLDLSTQQRHIQQLEKDLAENRQSVAPFDGVVTRLNAAVGFASSGSPELVLTDSAKGFAIECQIPGDVANLLEIGEDLDQISLIGRDSRQLTGAIVDIKESLPEQVNSSSGGNTGELPSVLPHSVVRIEIKDTKLQGGERVKIAISKESENSMITVPNEAIHYDERSAYVFTLDTDSGPLGNAYRAVETPVTIADKNSFVAGISEGLFPQQEVILHSAKDFLMDGMRVRR